MLCLWMAVRLIPWEIASPDMVCTFNKATGPTLPSLVYSGCGFVIISVPIYIFCIILSWAYIVLVALSFAFALQLGLLP